MITHHTHRPMAAAAAMASCILLAGCAQGLKPPPPAAYASSPVPFAELAPELRQEDVEVLYVTDRTLEENAYERTVYGIARSPSVAFGAARVRLSVGGGWDGLVAWTESREDAPITGFDAEFLSFEELGRFPETPYLFELDDEGHRRITDEVAAEIEAANVSARAVLRERLARAPVKRVDLYVHGIRTEFESFVTGVATDWHLSGRLTVPVAYSWPAGGGGVLSAYAYDRESGEFTVAHLKQVLRGIAQIPEVEGINVYAHSRGTDVATTALRELFIEARASGQDIRATHKIDNLVLLAPDLDLEVVSQRLGDEGVGSEVGRITIYTNADDGAIGAARNLFNSRARLGSVRREQLDERQRELIRRATNVDFVVYAGSGGGGFRHSYYRSPAVRADVLLVVRDGREPGEEHGRPLQHVGDHFWKVGDDYLR